MITFKMGMRALIVASALTIAAVSNAQGYKDEYKLSLVVGTAFPWGQGGQIWADLVKERTDGRINIKLYPGVSLVQGDQTREFSALRQGVIDLAVGSTINWSPQVKELNIFSLPFLTTTYAGTDAMTQGEVGKKIFQAIDAKGVLPLAWGVGATRCATLSPRRARWNSLLGSLWSLLELAFGIAVVAAGTRAK